MPFYKVTGNDPKSDDGHFVVVIIAQNWKRAVTAITNHLKAKGREDLEEWNCEKIDLHKGCVIHSTIQRIGD